MEDQRSTEPVPVLELQYQSGTRLREVDLIRLVAKWCIAIGISASAYFAIQVTPLFFDPSVLNFPRGMTPMNWFILIDEMTSQGVSVWLLVCGVHVLRGRMRFARWLGIGLMTRICISLIFGAVQNVIYWNILQTSGISRPAFIARAFLGAFTSCFVAAILLTILRQSAVRDAIKDMS